MPTKKQAPKEKRKTEREAARKNAKVVQDAVLEYLVTELRDNPDFISELPASSRAQLVMQHLPKVQPVDQDLEKNVLSLSNLLKDLPDAQELTRQLSVLKLELRKRDVQTDQRKTLIYDWKRTIPDPEQADKFLAWFDQFAEAFIGVGQQMAGLEVLNVTKEHAVEMLEEICRPEGKRANNTDGG